LNDIAEHVGKLARSTDTGDHGQIGGRSGGDRGVTIGWEEHVRRKLRGIPLKKRRRLHKSKQLRVKITRELEAEGLTLPKDPHIVLAIIREFL
jgi:hypothetical protein